MDCPQAGHYTGREKGTVRSMKYTRAADLLKEKFAAFQQYLVKTVGISHGNCMYVCMSIKLNLTLRIACVYLMIE